MACRRVIRVFERVVKEFMSQFAWDLTRIIVDHCIDSNQEQSMAEQSRKKDSTETSKNHPTPQKTL
jgi:hypothetical protein